MDDIEVRIERQQLDEDTDAGAFMAVGLFVNGTSLQSFAKRVERPFAEAEGQPDLAGSYAGLMPPATRERHYLDEPTETWFCDGDTILLGCTCGEAGCWPLTAQVDVSATTVTWRGFRNGHRVWDLSAVGPFTFERHAYEAAFRRAFQGLDA